MKNTHQNESSCVALLSVGIHLAIEANRMMILWISTIALVAEQPTRSIGRMRKNKKIIKNIGIQNKEYDKK